MSTVSTAHPDRRGLDAWLLTAVVVAVAVTAGIAGQMGAQGRLGGSAGAAAGVVVALLAVLGLPSVSVRLAARAVVATSAAVLVRYAAPGGAASVGGQALLAWAVAASAVIVLTDRIGTDANPPLGAPERRRTMASTARAVAIVATVVVLTAVLLGPAVASRVTAATAVGSGPVLDPAKGSGAMRATSSLDMTTRPALTDEVVFTVESNRGTFWRGETFDIWDGRTWTRSDEDRLFLVDGGRVEHSDDDLGAEGDDVVTQRFRVEANFANVLYGANTASTIEAVRGAIQRPDGTLFSAPLGKGAGYKVVSRRFSLTEERLRAAGDDVPADVRTRYASAPRTTARVVAAARDAVDGATTTYDKVRALERWMGARTEYSIDAPLAPEGVDVVDHFLFTSREGWCEQIASSLVVLARANGIPARLVTGFAPGEQDPVTGRFTVRARDAHAWAEVWFAGLGWVPFDPTADVPLAGADQASDTWAHWLLTHWVYLVVAAAVMALLVGPVRMLLRELWRKRALRPTTWAAQAERSLDHLGKRANRERAPGETASAYARALGERYGEPRLEAVGLAVDDALYAPAGVTTEEQAAADHLLATLKDADLTPQRQPPPTREPAEV